MSFILNQGRCSRCEPCIVVCAYEARHLTPAGDTLLDVTTPVLAVVLMGVFARVNKNVIVLRFRSELVSRAVLFTVEAKVRREVKVLVPAIMERPVSLTDPEAELRWKTVLVL